jgi:hypothetical protein
MQEVRAATVVRKIAAALEHAHGKDIVHRDLKPANVMIATDGDPVVMDFGLAKKVAAVDPDEVKLTRIGGIVGTPSYMSPEQAKGDAVGAATDVYSLGVMLFEVLTGKVPYAGSPGRVVGQIIAAPVPPVREFRPEADSRLDAICRKAMAKEPADRFEGMAEFASALDEYLAAPAPAPPPPLASSEKSRAPAVTAGHSPFGDLEVGAPPRPGRRKSRQGMLVALALLLPLALGVAAVVLRVETPSGTLIVEMNDDEVEARIKGGKLVLYGSGGKERYELTAMDRGKKLDAGNYLIRVEGADGLALDTPEFTMKRGGEVKVRVTLAPKAAAKKQLPRASDLPPPAGGVEDEATVGIRTDSTARAVSRILGDWKADATQIVVNDRATVDCQIAFGDATWIDYDFVCEVKKLSGRGEFTQIFRVSGTNQYEFTVGKYDGAWESVGAQGVGKMTRLRERRTRVLETGRWYTMEVRVRGARIVCRLDGEDVLECQDERYPRGGVGLRTWNTAAAFRNIRVTDPKGEILFEGVPDMNSAGR